MTRKIRAYTPLIHFINGIEFLHTECQRSQITQLIGLRIGQGFIIDPSLPLDKFRRL